MLRLKAQHIARIGIKASLRSEPARGLHAVSALRKAEFLKMPAMSPTMTKGGVADWKFKEGEAFNSGDVLLEVETDKSQIDVEAQDDGLVAKILVQNGASDIPVGTPIAIIAEPDDDLATLELPKVQADKPAPKKTESTPEAPPVKSSSSSSPSASSESVSIVANPDQTLLPSVASLLSANNISKKDAIANIKATGSNGRILKGDVLAYLGKIPQESVDRISSFVKKNSDLDLSNIEKLKIKPRETPKDSSADVQQTEVKINNSKPEPKIITKNILLKALSEDQKLALQDGFKPFTLGEYITRASERAERFAYQSHPKQSDLYDPVFEDLVTPSPSVERFKVKLDIPVKSGESKATSVPDFFDFAGNDTRIKPAPSQFTVTVTVNPKVIDAEEKAKLYLEKLESYVSDLN